MKIKLLLCLFIALMTMTVNPFAASATDFLFKVPIKLMKFPQSYVVVRCGLHFNRCTGQACSSKAVATGFKTMNSHSSGGYSTEMAVLVKWTPAANATDKSPPKYYRCELRSSLAAGGTGGMIFSYKECPPINTKWHSFLHPKFDVRTCRPYTSGKNTKFVREVTGTIN